MSSLMKNLVTGDGRDITVSDLAKLHRDTVNQSIPIGGAIQQVGKDAYSLINQFRVVDCDTLRYVNTFKVYSLATRASDTSDCCIDSVRCISGAHSYTDLCSATSANGRFIAKLKSSTNPDGATDNCKQQLQIWDRMKLVKTIDISELEVHGDIVTNAFFSTFVWSPYGDQDKLLYICQRKRPKHSSFFKENKDIQKLTLDQDTKHYKEEAFEEFTKRENWGEQMADVEHTLVAILDASNNCEITTIDIDGISLVNSQWLDNGSKIVSVAYQEEPRKLGLIFHNNRRSSILVHDLTFGQEAPILEITSEKESYHTVRVDHSGQQFLYLTSPLFGCHWHSSKIYLYNISSKITRNLIDRSTKQDEFFVENLPKWCFTMDNKNILLVIRENLLTHICLYNLDDEQLMKIKFPTSSVSVFDFRHDIILASGSEINATPTIFVALLNTINIHDPVAWYQIEDCIHLHDIQYQTFSIPTEDKKSTVSAILVQPDLKVLQENYVEQTKLVANVNNLPAVIGVHGGPHSSFIVSYYSWAIVRARLGLRTVLVNYRGSLGVNEEYLQMLNGRVGELDVSDCLQVVRHLVMKEILDPKKLIIEGGSHGGFLSCHLSCQDEFKFTSAIIRNPVVDLATCYATSDIPDWSFNVALGHKQYDFSWQPKFEDLKRLYDCSPMSKVSEATVPTFMALGSKDLRVPMFQGERWIDMLKARGVETKCKVYNDNHSLSKVDVATDFQLNSYIWMLEHLK